MAEIPSSSSREEHEFWDAQFRDPPRPRRARRPARAARAAPDGLVVRVADRVRDWRSDARFGVVMLVVIALIAGVVWYRIGVGGASAGESVAAPRAVTTTVAATRTTAASTSSAAFPTKSKIAAATIAVLVAGAVNHPGVVELRAGARVIDAVEAVGGALADADVDRLNLAAKVSDGQRVFVAKLGQADPGVVGDTSATGTGGEPTASGVAGAKVNLNTATQAQLEALPGVGPTFAQSIIAERQRRGGFKSVNDLRSVHGIGDKRFAQLAPLLTL